jgi:hypothetical protein
MVSQHNLKKSKEEAESCAHGGVPNSLYFYTKRVTKTLGKSVI